MTARPSRSSLGLLVGLAGLALGAAAACGGRAPPPPAPRAVAIEAGAPAAVPSASATPAPSRARPTVALFYSSDLRGRVTALPSPTATRLPPGVGLSPLAAHETVGGLARRATLVDRARLDAAAVVQVDAGDFLPLPADEPRDVAAPGPKDFARWIDLVLKAYRRLGVDAVTLGERELASGLDPRRLAAKLAAAHVPVVLANLVDRKGTRVFPAHAVIDAASTSVGIFGVTELDAAATARLAKAGYALTSADEAARDEARALRAGGAKLVVALVHTAAGRARAAAIARAAPDVDVAVVTLGHEGGPAAAPEAGAAATAGPRVVAADGAGVGRLEVRFGPAGPPALSDAVLTLDKSVPEQLGVNLLSRALTISMVDVGKLIAESVRHNKVTPEAMRQIWEPWTYASTEACGYCHQKEVAQWKTTDHAGAIATLTKAKHDHDPACVGCHSMGFLQWGGTRDIGMVLGGFANVACESCHGPSAIHVRSVDKTKGTVWHVDPVVCLGCHTPDQNQGPFDAVAAMKDIVGPGHGLPGTKP
jgi:Cytochrome c554 and c-prime